MAMFGNRDPLGIEGMSPMAIAPVALQTGVGRVRPNFFGQGGTGRAIAGAIGDALLSANGQRPIYAPTMAQREADAREDAYRQQQLELARQKVMASAIAEPLDIQRKRDYLNSVQGGLGDQYLQGVAAGPPIWATDPATGQGGLVYRNQPAAPAASGGDIAVGATFQDSQGRIRRFKGGDSSNEANWTVEGGAGGVAPSPFPIR